MLDFLLADHAAWFSVPAVLATSLFLLRLALLIAGGDHGAATDAGGADLASGDVAGADLAHGGAGDLAGAHGAAAHGTEGASGIAAQLLSVQGLAAFFMGFGWAGLGALRGAGWGLPASFALGLAGGAAMGLLMVTVLRAVRRLEATGTLSPQAALGAAGEVYVTVPSRGEGMGQVRVVIRDRQRILNAVSEGSAIPTRARVRVVRVNEDSTITVVPI